MKEGIWITDKWDNIRSSGSGLREILGVSTEEALNKNLLIDFSDNELLPFLELYLQTKKSLFPHSYSIEITGKKSEKITLSGLLSPLIRNNKYDGMVCSVKSNIRENELLIDYSDLNSNKLPEIFENNSSVYFSRTPDYHINYISQNVEALIGFVPVGDSISMVDIISGNPRNEVVFSRLKKEVESKKSQLVYELELLHKDKFPVRVEIHEIPIRKENSIISFAGTIHALEKNDGISNEDVESSLILKTIFDNSPVPTAFGSKPDCLEYINERFTEVFGFQLEDIKGDKWWKLSSPEKKHREAMKNQWSGMTVFASNKDNIQGEDVVKCKDGSYKHVHITWNRIGGKLVTFFTDLTYLKKLEAELLDANKELKISKQRAEESDTLKSAFLANMSHEIRTPMNSIIGFSSLLAEEPIPEEKRQRYLLYIQNAGEHLLRIIDDIIDIAKIESNQLKIQISKVRLRVAMESIYEYHLQSNLLKRNSNINLVLNTDKIIGEPKFYSDNVRLKQIFDNLVTNAIKNTEEGFVEIGVEELSEEENYITFYVKDTGVGIPEESQENIFKRFQQVETQTAKKGAGLGLSITKGIVTLLGGTIWLISQVNNGSTFYFKLPLTKD